MSPTETTTQFFSKPSIPAWVSAAVSIAGVLIIVGVLWADVRANTQHRRDWRHINPEKMERMPENIAAITEQIKALRRDLNLTRDKEQ